MNRAEDKKRIKYDLDYDSKQHCPKTKSNNKSNNNLNNKIEKTKGSITIEAALIFPLVIMVFIAFLSLMNLVTLHAKVQVSVNQVCKQLSYDSYLIYELGLTEKTQRLYQTAEAGAISTKELEELVERYQNLPRWQGKKERDRVAGQELMQSGMEYIRFMGQLLDRAKRISPTLASEGMYYINTELARRTVRKRLDEQLALAKVKIDYRIRHAQLFLADDDGIIIIDYPYQLPIQLGDFGEFTIANSGYVRIFSGEYGYSELLKKAKKTSDYGKEEQKDKKGQEQTVYITPNGAKYHLSDQCFHIRVHPRPIGSDQAKRMKKCSRCFDDVYDSGPYYATESGRVCHKDRWCSAIHHHIVQISREQAIARGYCECRTCAKQE